MKKPLLGLLLLLYWCCYFVLIAVMLGVLFQNVQEADFWYLYLVYAILPSVITFFTSYQLLFSRYFAAKKYIATAIAVLLVAGCATWLAYITAGNPYLTNAVGQFAIILAVSVLSGISGLVVKVFVNWFHQVKIKEELIRQNSAMELSLLKAQLDPHFLFNSINNIDVLILKDPGAASAYLNSLSQILRFMIYECKPDRISLAQEIDFIKRYISLQNLRTANQQFTSFTIHGQPEHCRIAPMTLMPFVENAFKHVPNKKEKMAIEINIGIAADHTQFICRNKVSHHATPSQNGGIGNELICKRLALLYAGRHRLDILHDNHSYTVNLIIPNE